MHSFAELADSCATFSLQGLTEVHGRTVDALQTSGVTSLVKTLQMVRLQKVILAIGIFSFFEAILQDGLKCHDGFREAANILDRKGEAALKGRFADHRLAINVLKHGRGQSYDSLVAKAAELPFRVKLPWQTFFFEGDVSEVSTLIDVDDAFVLSCVEVVGRVSEVVSKVPRAFV
jgi:hypothetical protein